MVKPKSRKGVKGIKSSNIDVKNLKHPSTKVSHTTQPVVPTAGRVNDFLDDFEVIEKTEYSMDEEEYTEVVSKDPYM